MSSNVWRLFYQDSNYTYLITDEVVGSYRPFDYRSSYTSGLKVSTIGQRLNPRLMESGTFFTMNNSDENIRATAWLTDTSDKSMWNEYKNNDSVFAIGSPTAELYVASFNATANTNSAEPITLEVGTYGYTQNTTNDRLETSYNYGIYNKSKSSYWWLASPINDGGLYVFNVWGGGGMFLGYSTLVDGMGVRPLVCIQTSVFDEKYTLPFSPVVSD